MHCGHFDIESSREWREMGGASSKTVATMHSELREKKRVGGATERTARWASSFGVWIFSFESGRLRFCGCGAQKAPFFRGVAHRPRPLLLPSARHYNEGVYCAFLLLRGRNRRSGQIGSRAKPERRLLLFNHSLWRTMQLTDIITSIRNMERRRRRRAVVL